MAMNINLKMCSNIIRHGLKKQLFFILCFLLASDFRLARTTSTHHQHPIRTLRNHQFVRCTRRFTPGMCVDDVEPVWTFVFQQQNCTERLGCPSEWRVNRFKSYGKCMRRCKSLIDVYTQFLVQGADNLTDFSLRSRVLESGRRDIEYYGTFDNSEEYTDKVQNQHIEGPEPDPMEYEYDRNHHEYTVDIDYVEREDSGQDVDDD